MHIIKELNKVKNKNIYNLVIDDKTYTFDEDTILEFHLFKDKEIDDDILDRALNSAKISSYYEKALSYSIKYAKGSKEVYYYLLDKGLDINSSHEIVNKLVERKIIDDKNLIKAIIYSLIKNYNGRMMIIEKLKIRKFDSKLIDEEINNLDYDFYIECLNKLYEKIKHKYDKFDDYIRVNKIKNYLYQRGYSSSDIGILDIK